MGIFGKKRKSLKEKAVIIYKDLSRYRLNPHPSTIPDIWKDRKLSSYFMVAFIIQQTFFDERKYGEPVHIDFIISEIDDIAPLYNLSLSTTLNMSLRLNQIEGIIFDGSFVTVIGRNINYDWYHDIVADEIANFPKEYFD